MKNASSTFRRLGGLCLGLTLAIALMATGITREVPIGGISGTVRMAENGQALPNATVVLRPKTVLSEDQLAEIRPEERPRSYVTETDANGKFSLRQVTAGDYEIEASGQAHRIEPVAVTVIEGQATTQDIALKPDDPYLNLYANENVFLPGEEIRAPLHGFTPERTINVEVYRLEGDSALRAGSLRGTLQQMAGASRDNAQALTSRATRVSQESRTIENRDIEGIFRHNLAFKPLPEGMYFVRISAGQLSTQTYLNVTRIALVTKQADADLLTYATDLDSGKPRAGARIRALVNGRLRELGRTDSKGLLRTSMPAVGSNGTVTLVAESGTSTAYVDLWGADSGNRTRILTYTDRPIYRPGDTVQYKGIVRNLTRTGYVTPSGGSVTLEIRDQDETLVDRRVVALSSMGTYAGSFSLNAEAPPGNYTIKSQFGGQTDYKSVTIAAYRKPEFSIKVTPEKPSYVSGERARATVQVDYYFGAPVAGAEVRASLYRAPSWDWLGSDEDAEMYEQESGYGGEYIDEVVATTDEGGKAVIEFDTKYDDAWLNDTDSVFTVSVSVSEGEKYFSGEGRVKVTRGGFALQSSTDRTLADVNQPVSLEVVASEHGTKAARSGVPVTVVAGYEVWTGNESVFRPLDTQTLTTDQEGKARASFTPNRGGSFVLRASADDGRGNQIRSVQYVYVYSGAAEEGPPAPRIELKLDKRRYRPGDQATVVVLTDQPGGQALLTVEADGILQTRTVNLDKPTTRLTVPVSAEMRPNAFVNVTYVRKKRFNSSGKRLMVDLGARKLQTKLTADKAVYLPGETATYEIETRDAQGKPVSAEVSLGVVDEAIYAIYDDRFDIVREMYPVRYNNVRTSYSFESIYLDGGDKAPSDIQIRRLFKDTAFWTPTVTTDASGKARVSVALPDNLTTWRATAVALTQDTAVGQAVHKVRAKKDLMVRLQAPVFLTQKDERRLLAMVTNDTERDADINVELSAQTAQVTGDLRRRVTVPAGGTRPVEWTISTPEPGTAEFVAKAWVSGGASDGVELKVPVRPHGRTTFAWRAGSIADSAEFSVPVLPNADRTTGRLRITVSPTLASSLVQSLDDLIDFPYGCVEQTLNRFVPTVAVSQTLRSSNAPPISRAAQIPQMVAEGFTRLKKMQHSDGGWGWWENDASDLGMTALVLEGLWEARRAGFEPNAYMVQQGVKWLAETAVKPELEPAAPRNPGDWDPRPAYRSRMAHAAYALALHGQREAASTLLRRLGSQNLRAVDWANVALAHGALGNSEPRDRALGALLAMAQESEIGASWTEDYWGVETTGRALYAISRVSPQNPILAKVVRSLMAKRRGGGWYSTRDTAAVILGLNEMWRQEGTFELSGDLAVLVNGREVRRVTLDATSFNQPDLIVDVPLQDLESGENRVQFTKSGPGTAYFTAELRQTGIEETLSAASSQAGFSVSRRFLKLTAQRTEDGRLRTLPSKDPVADFRRGEIVRVEVTLRTDSPRSFLILEDPIPSGFRVMERENIGSDEQWSYWWAKLVIRDDRVAFFVTDLPKGEHTFSYTLQAENPGSARVLPSEAYNMYEPDSRASSGGAALRVSP